MYEGWHVELTRHVRRRLAERGIDESDLLKVIFGPDEVQRQSALGRLLSKYLPESDRILIVAIEEYPIDGVLLVKTALWSKAN